MKSFSNRMICSILAIILIFGLAVPSLAMGKDKKTLKVGFYQLDGFFEYDKNGKEIGYGVDLLDEIGRETNYNFEYVPIKKWSDTSKALIDKKIDMYLPVTEPEFENGHVTYSEENILNTYYAIAGLKTRKDLKNIRKEKLDDLTFAVANYSIYNTDLKKYIDKLGIPIANITFRNSHEECVELMKNRKVDAVICDIMDFDLKTMEMLESVYVTPNILAFRKNDSDVKLFDKTIAKIKKEKPDFFDNLYTKYYPFRNSLPILKSEEAALNEYDGITFSFIDNRGYISDFINGEAVGIMPRISKFIADSLDIPYHAERCDNEKDIQKRDNKDNYIHCVGGYVMEEIQAKKDGLKLSDPVLYVQYNEISRKGKKINDKDKIKVALPKSIPLYNDFIEDNYNKDQIEWYTDMEGCLEAVSNGKADVTIANNYISSYFLDIHRFNNLTQRLLDSGHDLCFAVSEDEDQLVISAINKALDSMSDKEIGEILMIESARQPAQNSIETLVYGNTELFVLILVVIFALVTVLIVVLYAVNVLNKNNKKLQFATESKSQFISRISHDMRTPMNGILGISTLSDEHNTVEELHEDIKYIKSAGRVLLGLINDTLDIFKIENNKMELNIELVNGEEVIIDIARTMKPLMDEKNITFEINNRITNWVDVYADQKRIQQVVLNLLSNAVKFTNIGGEISLNLERIRESEDTITDRFTVKDNGIGMSEEFQKHSFDPFVQENRMNTDNVVGTGLGLSIVKKIVELMEGTITVKSEENVGTEISVTVELPIAKEGNVSQNIETDTSRLKGKRVLLCEDHPMNIKIAERQLRKQGIEVDVAVNGKIGVEKFIQSKEGYYDAILMDIRMPIMGGLEATKEIRKSSHSQSRTIPIIAISANALTKDVELSKAVGMNEHLSKPIDLELMYQTLLRLIK
ncbi:MAG: ATP-binding protein [Anaerovoracaceae bacterium]